MRRKIVLFFVFFLFIFLVAKQNASAASSLLPCDIQNPSPLYVSDSSITLKGTIVGKDILIANTPYQIIFSGTALRTNYQDIGTLILNNQPADANSNIAFSYTFPFLKSGDLSVTVAKNGSPYAESATKYCAWKTQITTKDPGGSCQADVTSTDNFKITASESFSVTFARGASSDRRKVWLIHDGAGSAISSFNGDDCKSQAELSSGFSLGQLAGGNYTIKIGKDCVPLSSPDDAACSRDFQVGKDGGGVSGSPGTTCYTCPVGYNKFNNEPTNPTCSDTSSKTKPAVPGFCSDQAPVCDPNHVLGCVGADGLPVNTKAPPTNPPFCDVSSNGSNATYTCHTAVGDIVASPQGFISSLFGLILSLSGGIALILIIISGYRVLASQGNPEALKGAREQLTAAIVGLLFVIFALVILEIIGFNILQIPGFGHSASTPQTFNLGGGRSQK